jgi:ferritin
MPQLSENLLKEMNIQIQEEMFSAYLYYSMSAYFESENLPGFGHWMRAQAMEEVTHAQRFFTHILERGGEVELLEIKKPQSKWDSPTQAFEDALNHEYHITSRIHHLMKIARDEGDFAAEMGILNWFVDEQIEEEVSVGEVLDKLKLIEGNKNGLYMLDKELAARAFTLPPTFNW